MTVIGGQKWYLQRGVSYDEGADLSRLYKTAARALQVAPEQIIKQILSGVATVVEGLAGLRNSLSDAHGRGKKAARPAPRHAKLAVNPAFAVAGFLIDSHVEKRTLRAAPADPPRPGLPARP